MSSQAEESTAWDPSRLPDPAGRTAVVTRVGSGPAAHDEDDARSLWQESERLTVVYDLPVPAGLERAPRSHE